VRQFEVRVDSLRGVYVHLDMNVSDLLIYDKNGPGKLLVLGSTMALKFGKYVGGLSGRMLETIWNRAIRADLRRRALIHPEHRGRAETVNLARPISSDELLEIVRPIAQRLDSEVTSAPVG
jgi:hypothetical protein